MAKRDDRIITSVYLTKEMCSQIDKMAAKEHISRNEQIRRYIEKGMAVEGYTQDIDLIAGIIRQELLAVYHIEDIKAVVEQQANRIAKSGRLMHCRRYFAEAFFVQDVAAMDDEELIALPETGTLMLVCEIYQEENRLTKMTAEERAVTRKAKVALKMDAFI